MASSLLLPQIYSSAVKSAQTVGLAGSPNIAQRLSSSSCMQGSPAAFPLGIPGMGEVMDGAVQHAPQPDRHCIFDSLA